jgi:hypothetical protein
MILIKTFTWKFVFWRPGGLGGFCVHFLIKTLTWKLFFGGREAWEAFVLIFQI